MLFNKIELKIYFEHIYTSKLLWYIQLLGFLYPYQILTCIQLFSEFEIVFFRNAV